MQFVYPFALFALLAIPILIIIYILRNKYKEETQPSTYLWEISERFLKKRNPLHSIEHLLALIIQILAITGLTLALAHPTFTLTGQADDIVFVLDASASMNMVRETTDKDGNTVQITRFEDAKTQILDKVNNATDGCTFTLVLGDKEPRVVCKKLTDIERFEKFLNSVNVSDSYCDLDEAVAVAQQLFSDGDCNYCYIATDRKEASNLVNEGENTETEESKSSDEVFCTKVIDVSTDQNNYAITSLDYSYADSNKKCIITGTVISYAEDCLIDDEGNGGLTVLLKINDEEKGVKHISCPKGSEEEFTIALSNSDGAYNSENISVISAQILETDCLAVDNTYYVYNNDVTSKTSVLLVSSTPRFFELAFKYLENITCKTITKSQYKAQAGYDIYIFDCWTPDELPSSGAVWLVDTKDVSGCGFYDNDADKVLEEGGKLEYPDDDTSLLFKQLTKNTAKNEITIKEYKRYSVVGDFTTVLQYKNVPMVFAGKNNNGQREVVFAFDIHDSDLPMQYDFLALVRNFVTYCNPTICKEYAYMVDDTMVLNLADSVSKITALTPSGNTELVDYNSQAVVSYTLEEVGTYEISVYTSEDTCKTIKVYASFDKEEGDPAMEIKAYNLVGNSNTTKGNGLLDNILPIIIAGAVLFALDWILYTHEQF